MSKLRVYVASNLDRARWVDCVVATMLQARGCELVSTWHSPPYPTPAQEAALTDDEAARIYARNMRDLSRAEVVLVIASETGGEHLCEAALAYHAGLRVCWLGRRVLTALQPSVERVGSLAEAVEIVAGWAERRSRPSWMPAARTVSP